MAQIEATVNCIRNSLKDNKRVVLLQTEREEKNILPIWIGPAEADAIAVITQKVTIKRPLSHDLVCSIITGLGADVKSCIISKLEDDIFYTNLTLSKDDNDFLFDCRPSEGISIALRAGAPILIEEEVLNEAGIFLDEKNGDGTE